MERVKEFYGLAKEYIEFIVQNEISMKTIPLLIQLLMKLYCLGMNLPDSNTLSDANPEVDVDEKSETNSRTLIDKIKWEKEINPCYSVIFNPLVDDDICSGNIIDDLSDIAYDLKEGIQEFDISNYSSAVMIWVLSFEVHWGLHVVNLIKTLHSLMYY